ncbi:hypothetical protein QYF36_008723 [Acer negundo]|nr:hypothetical protein QYF36_008723 [Acer negundo]
MNNIGLLIVCPLSPYLEQKLENSFKVFKLWQFEDRNQFFNTQGNSIRAVFGSSPAGADGELIETLPNIEIVSSCSVGMEKIDLVKLLRRLCESDRFVRSGKWKKGDYKLTTKFSEKSVGILGMGRIGTAIAKRAEAFNCSVSPKGVLINVGRGLFVDEPELVAALVEGRLGSAGLDEFENDPEVPEELFGLENVVLLPHVASGTVETRKAMADLVLGNLKAHFTHKPLLSPVSSLCSSGSCDQHRKRPEQVAALLEGRLGGAGLDAFEREPEVLTGGAFLELEMWCSHLM